MIEALEHLQVFHLPFALFRLGIICTDLLLHLADQKRLLVVLEHDLAPLERSVSLQLLFRLEGQVK